MGTCLESNHSQLWMFALTYSVLYIGYLYKSEALMDNMERIKKMNHLQYNKLGKNIKLSLAISLKMLLILPRNERMGPYFRNIVGLVLRLIDNLHLLFPVVQTESFDLTQNRTGIVASQCLWKKSTWSYLWVQWMSFMYNYHLMN